MRTWIRAELVVSAARAKVISKPLGAGRFQLCEPAEWQGLTQRELAAADALRAFEIGKQLMAPAVAALKRVGRDRRDIRRLIAKLPAEERAGIQKTRRAGHPQDPLTQLTGELAAVDLSDGEVALLLRVSDHDKPEAGGRARARARRRRAAKAS